MKKLIYVFAALFMFSTLTISAQKKDKTDKAAEKNAKAQAKADKKEAKLQKLIAEYEEFVKTYAPIAPCADQNANAVITSINTTFASLNSMYEKVGYVVIETSEKEDEVTGETTTVIERVYDKRYPEKTIDPNAKKNEYKQCTTEIVGLVAAATSLAGGVAGIVGNPQSLISLGLTGKQIVKHSKMIAGLVPMIQDKIKKDSEALEFLKNN